MVTNVPWGRTIKLRKVLREHQRKVVTVSMVLYTYKQASTYRQEHSLWAQFTTWERIERH